LETSVGFNKAAVEALASNFSCGKMLRFHTRLIFDVSYVASFM